MPIRLKIELAYDYREKVLSFGKGRELAITTK